MEDAQVELDRKLYEQIVKFLEACKGEGDATIDDVLRRLEELKKEA